MEKRTAFLVDLVSISVDLSVPVDHDNWHSLIDMYRFVCGGGSIYYTVLSFFKLSSLQKLTYQGSVSPNLNSTNPKYRHKYVYYIPIDS